VSVDSAASGGHNLERPTPPDTPPSGSSFWRIGPAVRCVSTCRAGTSIEAAENSKQPIPRPVTPGVAAIEQEVEYEKSI